MKKPLLSVIIPAFNEENRLPATLQQLADFLEAQSYTTEVVVVENGSLDRTLTIAQDFAEKHNLKDAGEHVCFRVIQERKRGKGLAVRRGIQESQGEYRFMCDADFSMPVSEINRFMPPALVDCDIAIASREAPGAVRIGEPAYRHFVGRVYNSLIRWIALPGLQDTQCGFKCFREAIALDLFSRQKIEGWSFDVELLFIAQRRGYCIVELPIDWTFNPESKISVWRDSLRMAMDLLRIRWNGLRGVYG